MSIRIGGSKSIGKGTRVYASKSVGGKGNPGCLTAVVVVVAIAILGGSLFGGTDEKESVEVPEITAEESVAENTTKEMPDVVDEEEAQPEEVQEQAETVTYIGSSESDKFHYPSCRFAKEISAENVIEFASREEAVNRGYTACGVCHP